MVRCNKCHGTGSHTRNGQPENCPYCEGTGEIESEDDIRWACREKAIANTHYRESGSEMADTMSGEIRTGLPAVVRLEYERLCRTKGIKP